MITQAFAVYDSKGEFYSSPQFRTNKGVAIRDFIDGLKKDSPVSQHPEDYTLFHIGEYDDQTGKFTPLDTPISLGVAVEFVNKVESAVAPHGVKVVS